MAAIANPLINITLQGRHDTYPKRRGMTRVPEIARAGITVAFGHDCVMDPWYGLGGPTCWKSRIWAARGADDQPRGDARRFDAVTETPAAILGLEGYGLDVGCHADLVLLQARDPVEAIRLRATRRLVMRRGKSSPARPPE